jgi:hypothetical protein
MMEVLYLAARTDRKSSYEMKYAKCSHVGKHSHQESQRFTKEKLERNCRRPVKLQ